MRFEFVHQRRLQTIKVSVCAWASTFSTSKHHFALITFPQNYVDSRLLLLLLLFLSSAPFRFLLLGLGWGDMCNELFCMSVWWCFFFWCFSLELCTCHLLILAKIWFPMPRKKMCALEHPTRVSVVDVVLVSDCFFVKSVLLVQLASLWAVLCCQQNLLCILFAWFHFVWGLFVCLFVFTSGPIRSIASPGCGNSISVRDNCNMVLVVLLMEIRFSLTST